MNGRIQSHVTALFQTLVAVPTNYLASVIVVLPAGVIYRGDLTSVINILTSYFPSAENWPQILSPVCACVYVLEMHMNTKMYVCLHVYVYENTYACKNVYAYVRKCICVNS